MYVPSHAHVCKCVCICICVCVSMCRSTPGIFFNWSLAPSFLEHSLSPNLEWSVPLGWVTSEHERSGYLCFSNSGTIGNCQPLLMSVLGIQTQVLTLVWQILYQLNHLPRSKACFYYKCDKRGHNWMGTLWTLGWITPALYCMVEKTPLCASPRDRAICIVLRRICR